MNKSTVVLVVYGRIYPARLLSLANFLGACNLSKGLTSGKRNHYTLCTKHTKTATTEIAIRRIHPIEIQKHTAV